VCICRWKKEKVGEAALREGIVVEAKRRRKEKKKERGKEAIVMVAKSRRGGGSSYGGKSWRREEKKAVATMLRAEDQKKKKKGGSYTHGIWASPGWSQPDLSRSRAGPRPKRPGTSTDLPLGPPGRAFLGRVQVFFFYKFN
jgi:hypothetical protein